MSFCVAYNVHLFVTEVLITFFFKHWGCSHVCFLHFLYFFSLLPFCFLLSFTSFKLCVCRHGLKVITPEETFTLLASSPMEKVNLCISICCDSNEPDRCVISFLNVCMRWLLGQVASLHQPGGGSGPEWGGAGHSIRQLRVGAKAGAPHLQNSLVHFL